MHPRRPAVHVATRQRDGVAVVPGAPEVPLDEADGAPVTQVDGGEQLHGAAHAEAWARAQAATKLARIPSPTGPDFSGWNCVPHTGPRSTAATTSPP